ncbi:mapeg family protein [Stylonychia lemnae]|uniref:Mapeg family protein n=1 Tax=Stylonychia lemnae TaxID=5949 RepID=A0A078B3W8_STYLE|nr:mapeg family protein [Stylonychia lemnae]|eukprot:CDW87877.1 mapeg family protein [Stylonychia lemnae]
MPTRIKTYKRTFMRQFDEIHEQSFGKGTKPPKLGYPDTGNGWYSKKLPYKQWYEMNVAQRMHLNYLEGITFVILVSIIGGISYPMEVFYAQIAYIIGRQLFAVAYYNMGPIFRVPGVIGLQYGQWACAYYSIKTCLTLLE